MKLGPGGGSIEAAADGERGLLSKEYILTYREELGRVFIEILGPSTTRMTAEIVGDESEKTLRFLKFSRLGGGAETDHASLVDFKGLILFIKNDIEKKGQNLAFVEVVSAEPDLKALSGMTWLSPILGAEKVKEMHEYHHPGREETPNRRATDPKPEPARFTLFEITELLKQYEEKSGKTIRQ